MVACTTLALGHVVDRFVLAHNLAAGVFAGGKTLCWIVQELRRVAHLHATVAIDRARRCLGVLELVEVLQAVRIVRVDPLLVVFCTVACEGVALAAW